MRQLEKLDMEGYANVKNSVDEDIYPRCLCSMTGFDEFVFGSPPRSSSTLLIKFTEIPLDTQ